MSKTSNPRVVIDTNLMISAAISAGSIPDQLLQIWRNDKYELIVSPEILQEIEEVSQRARLREKYHLFPKKISRLFAALKLAAEVIQPIPEEQLTVHCRDSKDDKFLALSISGKADFLITGDQDLLALSGNPSLNGLKIVTAKEFLENFL